MKTICFCLILIALIGTCPGGDQTAEQKTVTLVKGADLFFGPWQFEEIDRHLSLHFHRLADNDKDKVKVQGWSEMPHYVQLAGVETKFVPLDYFKGNEDERKRQKETNDEIAAFITEQLKGKKVWIDDAKPAVFAGPRQVLGIIWFEPERKRSLQQLLVEKGLAVKKSTVRPDTVKQPATAGESK